MVRSRTVSSRRVRAHYSMSEASCTSSLACDKRADDVLVIDGSFRFISITRTVLRAQSSPWAQCFRWRCISPSLEATDQIMDLRMVPHHHVCFRREVSSQGLPLSQRLRLITQNQSSTNKDLNAWPTPFHVCRDILTNLCVSDCALLYSNLSR